MSNNSSLNEQEIIELKRSIAVKNSLIEMFKEQKEELQKMYTLKNQQMDFYIKQQIMKVEEIHKLKEELQRMKDVYGILDEFYKSLSESRKASVDDNWRDLIYKWIDDIDECFPEEEQEESDSDESK